MTTLGMLLSAPHSAFVQPLKTQGSDDLLPEHPSGVSFTQPITQAETVAMSAKSSFDVEVDHHRVPLAHSNPGEAFARLSYDPQPFATTEAERHLQNVERTRVSHACERCRRRKIKCNEPEGGAPCDHCVYRKLQCVYGAPPARKKHIPDDHPYAAYRAQLPVFKKDASRAIVGKRGTITRNVSEVRGKNATLGSESRPRITRALSEEPPLPYESFAQPSFVQPDARLSRTFSEPGPTTQQKLNDLVPGWLDPSLAQINDLSRSTRLSQIACVPPNTWSSQPPSIPMLGRPEALPSVQIFGVPFPSSNPSTTSLTPSLPALSTHAVPLLAEVLPHGGPEKPCFETHPAVINGGASKRQALMMKALQADFASFGLKVYDSHGVADTQLYFPGKLSSIFRITDPGPSASLTSTI